MMTYQKIPSKLRADMGVRVPVRDGVELVADIYRPDDGGKWPTVLLRTPYDRTDPVMGQQRLMDPCWLARQGYAVVVQDVRGRGESEGEFYPVINEVDDGYDSVEWAADQPWSDGAVGIYGPSYMGITSYQAIAAHPPHLKAAVAFDATPWALGKRLQGNMFEASFFAGWAYMTALETLSKTDLHPDQKAKLGETILASLADPVKAASQLPLDKLPVLSDQRLVPYWHDWLGVSNSIESKSSMLFGNNPDLGDVALLHVGGYRDCFVDHSFELASKLRGNKKHKFIATPFTHRGPYMGNTGCRELPGTSSAAGPLGWGPMIAAWFDIHLRGGDGSAYPAGMAWIEGEPVRYYVEGVNRWAQSASWPPTTVSTEWHLTSAGNARSSSGDGRILFPEESPQKESSDSFVADPHNPFPTCGGSLNIPQLGPDGIQDQRQVDYREDVLVYTSKALESAFPIAGTQELVMHFSSSAPDADICVTLVDVEPSGFAYNVCQGQQRMRYRKGGQADWLEPGNIEEITIRLHDTAHVFKPGHRIRVMIAGANYPRFSRNLHTTSVPELGIQEEAKSAQYQIFSGNNYPSRLVLH